MVRQGHNVQKAEKHSKCCKIYIYIYIYIQTVMNLTLTLSIDLGETAKPKF